MLLCTFRNKAYKQFEGLFDDIDLDSKQLGVDANQRNITISEVIKT